MDLLDVINNKVEQRLKELRAKIEKEVKEKGYITVKIGSATVQYYDKERGKRDE